MAKHARETKATTHPAVQAKPKPAQREPFAFAGGEVPPGEEGVFALPVSAMSTGTPVTIPVRILHGAGEGPTVFVSAAVHGDEIVGTEIIRRLRRRLVGRPLNGTLMLVPVVNALGFIANSRYLPDRRDLNRSFPGASRGSLAAQLAGRFFTDVIKRCSLGIDIHSAAAHRYNLPQIRIEQGKPHLMELAMAFGAPAVMESRLRDGSMRQIAGAAGVDILLFEAGEALRFDEFSIRVGLAGILRVLDQLDMVDPQDVPPPPAHPLKSDRSMWLRAPVGGIARLRKESGAVVTKGDVLGIVGDILGENHHELVSPINGIIIGHSNLPVVNQGDALIHIAELHAAGEPPQISAYNNALLSSDLLDEDEVV